MEKQLDVNMAYHRDQSSAPFTLLYIYMFPYSTAPPPDKILLLLFWNRLRKDIKQQQHF